MKSETKSTIRVTTGVIHHHHMPWSIAVSASDRWIMMPSVVSLGSLDGAGDGGVVGCTEHGDQVSAGLEGDVGFEFAGVHGLEVSENNLVRVGVLDRGDNGEAFGRDQRGAELDDVNEFGNLAGQFEGGFGGQDVHGNLELHDVDSFL